MTLNLVGDCEKELTSLQAINERIAAWQAVDKDLMARMHVHPHIAIFNPADRGSGPKPEFWLRQSTQSPEISQPAYTTQAIAAQKFAAMQATANDKNSNSMNKNQKPEFWLRNK